jgi:hypothetical protein
MRQFKTDIIIFIALVVISLVVLLLTAEQSVVDIQLHDTYFVIDKISMTVLIMGPLMLLIFLGRALKRKFQTTGPNIGLIIGLTLVAVITFYVVQLQQSYLMEMMRLDQGFPGRVQFIVAAKNRLSWTCVLFGFWALGLLLLTLRTIKIWKEEYSS